MEDLLKHAPSEGNIVGNERKWIAAVVATADDTSRPNCDCFQEVL